MPKSKAPGKNPAGLQIEHSSDNVFKDIGYSDAEAANLLARAELMLKIRDIITENKWSQREAAKRLCVGQPRIAEIMSFNTKYFSVDLLLKYLAKLGTQVSFKFKKSKAA
jgi:predicted XRE-type DNA-binding protein